MSKSLLPPGMPEAELETLRRHVEEAKNDPDYAVVCCYESRWDETGGF